MTNQTVNTPARAARSKERPTRGGRRPRRHVLRSLGLTAVVLSGAGGLAACQPAPGPGDLAAPPASYVYKRYADPARTVVTTTGGALVATFTDGARTVTIAGPKRVLKEPGVAVTVTSTTWVRVLPTPFKGTVDKTWLDQQRANTKPDVLAQSMEYFTGAKDVFTASQVRIAGDSHYGPLDGQGKIVEGSDFNDYLGVPWKYGATTDKPEADQIGSMDCSGFMRMLWGYRNGVPLGTETIDATSLPRRAVQQEASNIGVKLYPNTGAQVKSFSKLAPGDLVFFDISLDDGTDIDHVGMYLGVDSLGGQRFVSSRQTMDGPGIGDLGGKSRLDGTGDYAKGYRGARRL